MAFGTATNLLNLKSFFLEISEFRQRVFDNTDEAFFSSFVNFEGRQNERVLEIGCGIGTDGARFAENGAVYTGIDVSSRAIEIAQTRFKLFDLPGALMVLDGTSDLYPLGRFDLVYSCGVIHHWPNLHKFISNIHNVLVPDGEFIFMVYASPSWDYAMSQSGHAQYEAQSGVPMVEVFTKEEIVDFLGDAFEITNIVQCGCFMYNVEQYRKKELVLEPWFAAMPEEMRQAVHSNLGKYFYVKAKKV